MLHAGLKQTFKTIENLEKHSSYPDLGTKKQWKKICENLSTENLSLSFLLQNFEIKKLSNKKLSTKIFSSY